MPGLASDYMAAVDAAWIEEPGGSLVVMGPLAVATVDLLELAERGLLDGTLSAPMRDAVLSVRRAVDAALIGRRTLGS